MKFKYITASSRSSLDQFIKSQLYGFLLFFLYLQEVPQGYKNGCVITTQIKSRCRILISRECIHTGVGIGRGMHVQNTAAGGLICNCLGKWVPRTVWHSPVWLCTLALRVPTPACFCIFKFVNSEVVKGTQKLFPLLIHEYTLNAEKVTCQSKKVM